MTPIKQLIERMEGEDTTAVACAWCSGSFAARNSEIERGNGRGRYCSRFCARSSRRMLADVDCANCGTAFRPARSGAEHCSLACYWANKDKRPALTMDFLLSRAEQDPNSGCWLWSGHAARGGYGLLSYNAKRVSVHRAALELSVGRKLSRDQFACHRCDTPACFRPDHLFVGTAGENTADSCRKGRRANAKGEHNNRARLTWDSVRAIRASSEKTGQLARTYGVSVYAVYEARTGRSWREPPTQTASTLPTGEE